MTEPGARDEAYPRPVGAERRELLPVVAGAIVIVVCAAGQLVVASRPTLLWSVGPALVATVLAFAGLRRARAAGDDR